MENYTTPLDNLTGKFMSLYLFADVENTPEIRKKLLSGAIECCVVKASMVVDPFQISVAANKAALRQHRCQLTTRSVFTEILYVMSSSSNISLSLSKFGIHDSDTNIIFVSIHDESDNENLEREITELVKGRPLPLSKLRDFMDEPLVKKTYKIDDEELGVSSLLYSVCSRIGSDYSVSLK